MRPALFPLLMAIAMPAVAQPIGVTVTEAWSRATVSGAQTGAVYVTVTARQPDRLVSISTPVAATAELHQSQMINDVMEMRPVPGGLPVAPGAPIKMMPGGYHIMLMGLRQSLKEGSHLPVTLVFEHAGAVEADATVASAGARAPVTLRALPAIPTAH